MQRAATESSNERMKVLVTGSAGFIGEFVVQELLRRGHQVTALVRSSVPDRWHDLEKLEVVRCDLRQPGGPDLDGKNIDVVLHLAAATKGPVAAQFEDTVSGTANLLTAVRRARVRRIVGISSIAVLDYGAIRPMTVIDEQLALPDGARMGKYATSKLRQERLFHEFAKEHGNACTILRPGLVYDESRLVVGHAGIISGRFSILASHSGEVPTIEVRGLAAAIANAVERIPDGCEVIHLVDDRLPNQSQYIAGLRRRGLLPRARIVLPWWLLQAVARVAGSLPAALGYGRRLPEFLLPRGCAARVKPFRWSNAKAQRLLEWVPGRGFA